MSMKERPLIMQGENRKIRPKPPVTSIVKSMHDIDGEMSNILEREDIPLNDKMTLYDQTLQKYISRYNQYTSSDIPNITNITNTPTTTTTNSNSTITTGDPIQDLILKSVPEKSKSKTAMLMDRLKTTISWNDRGEFGYKDGPVIQGSNLVDLVGNAARHKSLKNVNPEGINTFLTALRDVNAPQSWISNKDYLKRMQNVASTPLQSDVTETPTNEMRQQETPAMRRMASNVGATSTDWDDEDDESGYTSLTDTYLTPVRQMSTVTRQPLTERLKTWTTYTP